MTDPTDNGSGGNATPAAANSSRPLSLSERVRSLRLPERKSMPAQGTSWLPWVLCALLGASTAFFALRSSAAEEKEKDTRSASTSPQAVQPAGQGDIVLTAKGYIIPVHQIQVSPKVGGMIMELFIEEGMRVPEDFVLANLSDRDRALGQVEAAKRRLGELTEYRQQEIQQAEAELEDTREQRKQLFLDWQRSEHLRKARALSDREYEVAYSTYRSMDWRVKKLGLAYELMQRGPRDERIAAAKGELRQAEADLAKAQWKLDNCVVRAPVAGTILTKKAEKGAQVNPAAFSNGLAASLCDMANLAELEVELKIAERDISKVAAKQKCEIRAEAYPDRVYQGHRVQAPRQSTRIVIPAGEAEGTYLRPEMGAIVTFLPNRQ